MILGLLIATLPSASIAGENEETLLCESAYATLTNSNIDYESVEWEVNLFSPNLVAFVGSEVVCKVGLNGIVELRDGNELLVSDGWPIGNEDEFRKIESAIENRKSELMAQVDRLEDIERRAEGLLRSADATHQQLQSIFSEASSATGVEIAAPLDQSGTDSPNSQAVSSETQPPISQLVALIADRNFAEAHEALRGYDLSEDDSSRLIEAGIAAVRPIPASEVRLNLEGYRLLAFLDPSNSAYRAKVQSYQNKLIETEMPSLSDLAQELSTERTRLQRDAYWKQVDGKLARFSGRVTNVTEGGFLSDPQIDLETGVRDVTVFCNLDPDFADAENLLSVNVGDRLTCTGTISDYTLILGSLAVSLRGSNF